MLNKGIKKLIFILLTIIIFYLLLLIIPIIKPFIVAIMDIILPFIIAFMISFVLYPIVNLIEKLVKKRWISLFITLFFTFLIIFLFGKYIFSILIEELEILKKELPKIIKEVEDIINLFLNKLPIKTETIKIDFDMFLSKEMINDTLFDGTTIKTMINIIKYIIIVPIIVIYLILDYDKILCSLREFLIKNNKERFKNYLGELNETMSNYVRGVLIVMVILFLLFSIIFIIIGLDNALIFALFIAVTNIIPYLGSYMGTALPVLYALLTSKTQAIIILVICIIIQSLEADFLTPYIQGKQLKLHPLIVIFSLLFFGKLFGFLGMIMAVPLCSVIKITLKYYGYKKINKEVQN